MKKKLLFLCYIMGLSLVSLAQINRLDVEIILEPYESQKINLTKIYFTELQARPGGKLMRLDWIIQEEMSIRLTDTAIILGNRKIFSLSRIYYIEVEQVSEGLQLTLFINNRDTYPSD